jgi:TatA/E family protein of Tat protein translocase
MLLFLNISGGEILLILIVVYLVFGPKKIPELARMVGKGINEMRRATDEIRKEFNREVSSVKKDMAVDLDLDLEDPLATNRNSTGQETKSKTNSDTPSNAASNKKS